MEKEKVRQSNFELLRIISMLMIVTLHYMGKGGALSNTAVTEVNFAVSHIAEALSIVAVNCYMLISGYFLVTSSFKWKKVIILWAQVLFYSIGIYILLLLLGIEHLSYTKLFNIVLPVFSKSYWFVSGYIALLLLSPFLNIAIKAFNKKQLGTLVLLLFGIMSLWSSLVAPQFLYTNSGYSLPQFVFLYILAAYVRLHWDFKVNKHIYLAGYFAVGLIISLASIPMYAAGNGSGWFKLMDYSHVGVVIESFCLFMFFREIRVQSVIINKIGGLTLAVYLIHEHLSLRGLIYKGLHTGDYYHSIWFIPHAIGSILLIFTIGICADAIRKVLFDRLQAFFTKPAVISERPLGKEM